MDSPEPVDEKDQNSDLASTSDGTNEATKTIIAEKTAKILEACSRKDIASLQELAQSSGGFLRDKLRQLACMQTTPVGYVSYSSSS